MNVAGQPVERAFHSLKFADWPSFDRRLFEEARKPGTLFRPGGPAARWSARTLETVTYRYGVALWWLAAIGRLDPDLTPVERLTPAIVAAFVDAYGADHASNSLLGIVHGVHEAVRVMQPQVDIAHIALAVARIKAVARARPKLPRMADHGELWQLGEALVDYGARRVEEGHMLSAASVRDGCMILFLVACPLRRRSFAALRLAGNFLRERSGYRVALNEEETKTRQSYDADLPETLTPYLDLYIDKARPVLQGRSGEADKGWLWLGAEGTPMTGKAMSRRINQLTERHLERPMSMHLFRDAAATAVALGDPAHIGIVASVLGHTRHATSEKHYNQAESFDAFHRLHKLLDRERERGRRHD